MNIYNISEEYLILMNEIEEAEGELTPELLERLEINRENFEDKMKAYKNVIDFKERNIGYAKDEIARLTARRKTHENLIKRLKLTQSNALKIFGNKSKTSKSGYNYDFDTFKASTWQLDKLDVNEDDLDDTLDELHAQLVNFKFDKINFELFPVEATFLISDKHTAQFYASVARVAKEEGIIINTIIKPNSKAILAYLLEDEDHAIKGYRLDKTDVIRLT